MDYRGKHKKKQSIRYPYIWSDENIKMRRYNQNQILYSNVISY